MKQNAIVVLKAEEQMSDYYLAKVTTVQILNKNVKDNYGQQYSFGTREVKGHNFELVPKAAI